MLARGNIEIRQVRNSQAPSASSVKFGQQDVVCAKHMSAPIEVENGTVCLCHGTEIRHCWLLDGSSLLTQKPNSQYGYNG